VIVATIRSNVDALILAYEADLQRQTTDYETEQKREEDTPVVDRFPAQSDQGNR
jgi:hypothetical protein